MRIQVRTAPVPVILLATLLLAGQSRAGSEENPAAVPRYALEVGQELTYQESSGFKHENGSWSDEDHWTVWVVRRNDNGTWRLVLRKVNKSSQTYDDGQTREHPDDTAFAYCDIQPDGRFEANPSLRNLRVNPSDLFPRLPEDTEALRTGWDSTNSDEESQSRFHLTPGTEIDSDPLIFVEARERLWDEIYLSTRSATYTLDRDRGLIARTESEWTQGYGFKGKGAGTTELRSVEQRDPDWVKQFDREADQYFKADRRYRELMTLASKDAERCVALLDDAKSTVEEARQKVSLPEIRDPLDQLLKEHDGWASYHTERVNYRAEILGEPAPSWSLEDLEGQTHALEAYRGQVVVMDFWYRGCGWCLKAMPQIKQLAEAFAEKPVAVLGMNIDDDEEDARFVVEKMGLNYPTLKAEGVPEKYHVSGYPTLIIIDSEGKVADIHVGYSPTLFQEVSKVVNRLLEKE